MRISDWSSDVCSSDLQGLPVRADRGNRIGRDVDLLEQDIGGLREAVSDRAIEANQITQCQRRVGLTLQYQQLLPQRIRIALAVASQQRLRASMIIEFADHRIDRVDAGP